MKKPINPKNRWNSKDFISMLNKRSSELKRDKTIGFPGKPRKMR